MNASFGSTLHTRSTHLECTAEVPNDFDRLRDYHSVVSVYSVASVAVILDMPTRLESGPSRTPLAASNLKAQQGHRTTL